MDTIHPESIDAGAGQEQSADSGKYFVVQVMCPDAVGITHVSSQWITDQDGEILQSVARVFGDIACIAYFVRLPSYQTALRFSHRLIAGRLRKRLLPIVLAASLSEEDSGEAVSQKYRRVRSRTRVDYMVSENPSVFYQHRWSRLTRYTLFAKDQAGLLAQLTGAITNASLGIDLHDGVTFRNGDPRPGKSHKGFPVFMGVFGVWIPGTEQAASSFDEELHRMHQRGDILEAANKATAQYFQWPP